MDMIALALALLFCSTILWSIIFIGRVSAKWVQRCPVCRRYLEQPLDSREPMTCQNCGWTTR